MLWAQVPPDCEKPDLPFPSHARSISEERALAQESGNQGSSPKELNILPRVSNAPYFLSSTPPGSLSLRAPSDGGLFLLSPLTSSSLLFTSNLKRPAWGFRWVSLFLKIAWRYRPQFVTIPEYLLNSKAIFFGSCQALLSSTYEFIREKTHRHS